MCPHKRMIDVISIFQYGWGFFIISITITNNSIRVKSERHAISSDFDSKRSSGFIDKSLNSLSQDDPGLIKTIKNHYIYPPSTEAYNFSSMAPDVDGQFGQANYIANKLFKVCIHTFFLPIMRR